MNMPVSSEKHSFICIIWVNFDPMDDKELIGPILNGESQAFKTLVDTYQDKVYNTIFSFVHHPDEALDLSQDVFVEVFQSLPSFKGNSSLSTWIYRISVNKSLNYLRKKRHTPFSFLFRKAELKNAELLLTDPADESPDAHEKMENRELELHLRLAIDQLPERQRTAFILDKFEDLSYKQIAEVMQISLSSVESLIHRAKINLRTALLKTK
jgi:RNA polymerase sigma-70 factor (ECF subfamily)